MKHFVIIECKDPHHYFVRETRGKIECTSFYTKAGVFESNLSIYGWREWRESLDRLYNALRAMGYKEIPIAISPVGELI